jgi:hydrogenase maturation protease
VKRIVITGIGNVLLGDDGLGPYVIEELRARYSFGPEVELIDAGTPALDFILYFADVDLLLIVDAVRSSAPPGTVLRYTREDILRHHAPLRIDTHAPALGHALLFAEFAGASPPGVFLFGAAAGNTEPGTRLSNAVRGAVPALMDIIAQTVRAHGSSVDLLPAPRQALNWWEAAT